MNSITPATEFIKVHIQELSFNCELHTVFTFSITSQGLKHISNSREQDHHKLKIGLNGNKSNRTWSFISPVSLHWKKMFR